MLLMPANPDWELFDLCRYGTVDEAARMLADPALRLDVNQSNRFHFGYTPLHIACENGHVEVVRLLLSHPGIDPEAKSRKGWTPLFLACLVGWVEGVALLLRHPGVDVNNPANDGTTPVTVAIEAGQPEVLEWLIASGRSLDFHVRRRLRRLRRVGGEVKEEEEKEERVETRKAVAGHSRCEGLMRAMEEEEDQIRWELQCALGFGDWLAPELLAMIVLVSDGYLDLPGDPSDAHVGDRHERFFRIARRLPIELQTALCHRLFRSPKDTVRSGTFDTALRSLLQRGLM